MSRVVSQRAPSWSPKFLDWMVADRIYREVEAFALAVRDDPDHQLRKALDTFLAEFAKDLQNDPATMARAEAIKDRIVEQRPGPHAGRRVHGRRSRTPLLRPPTIRTRRCGSR